MKIISTRVYNQDQSWNFEKTVVIVGHKLRIKIRRNAYDNQSSATVERWNGEKWNEVVSVPITDCKCRQISYVQSHITEKEFKDDFDMLLNEAKHIICN